MLAVFLILYSAIGVCFAAGSNHFLNLDLPLAIAGGAVLTALLAQAHLFVSRIDTKSEALEQRMDAVEQLQRDTNERADVLEARTQAVETAVKHELTERRDALVHEMKHLESLIERLALSFESRMAETLAAPVQPAINGHNSVSIPAAIEPGEDTLLREVKEALYEGRADLHLQPIVSLPQRRVAFYEGFTRLRRTDGSLIMPAEFLDAAHRANLLGVIDNMMLYRSVEIVRRLAQRDRRVGVFCNISVPVLADPHLFPMFLEHMQKNRDLAGALIFELRADHYAKATQAMRQGMQQLMRLGFRFSLDHADTVALDLQQLQNSGIRFVKIRGADLIEQLRSADGPRPTSLINRPLDGHEVAAVCSRYGVTLIVEKLEDEASVLETLDYAIPYGQGYVFGAPRAIKNELMEQTAPPKEFVRRLTAPQ